MCNGANFWNFIFNYSTGSFWFSIRTKCLTLYHRKMYRQSYESKEKRIGNWAFITTTNLSSETSGIKLPIWSPFTLNRIVQSSLVICLKLKRFHWKKTGDSKIKLKIIITVKPCTTRHMELHLLYYNLETRLFDIWRLPGNIYLALQNPHGDFTMREDCWTAQSQ